ncbi:MAG TPA: hypothetical protein PKM48_03260 [Parvularculaceae bacterium]|nr:hypothetical protein [Parvularculaceae bacterium]HNS88249.1 hypothetical protein [Parvularculaceae bacterium]
MSPVAFSLIAFIVLTAAAGGAHLVELAVGRARRGARMERLPQ